MSKKILKTTFAFILILLIVSTLILTVNAVDNTTYSNTMDNEKMNRNFIVGLSWNETDKKWIPAKLNLGWHASEGKKINVIYKEDGLSPNDPPSNIAILNQPNVWCVQHGQNFNTGKLEYEVGPEITVTDKVIAYILCHGPEMGSMETENANVPAQVALWEYLSKGDDFDVGEVHEFVVGPNNKVKELTDKKYMLYDEPDSSITCNPPNEDGYDELGDGEYYDKGIEIYNYAIKYAEGTLDSNYEYTAKYRILKNAENQRMIVVTYAEKEDATTDVSLQKYITQINGKDLTKTDIDLDTSATEEQRNSVNNNDNEAFLVGRWAKRAKNDFSNNKDKITSNGGGVVVDSDYQNKAYYKINNPVKIEVGDTVTYCIKVYNNKNLEAKNVKVEDYLKNINNQTNLTIGNQQSDVTIEGSTLKIGDNSETPLGYKIINYSNTIQFDEFTLPAEGTATIAIKVKFNKHYANKIENVASLKMEKNKTEYRTEDADYVMMKKYSVSLEKYVVAIQSTLINGNQIIINGSSTIIDDRGGKPEYDFEKMYDFDRNGRVDSGDPIYIMNYYMGLALDEHIRQNVEKYGDINKDGNIDSADYILLLQHYGGTKKIEFPNATWKKENPVAVEPGDFVIFNIRLTNTGNTPVKVTKISDQFTFADGVQLTEPEIVECSVDSSLLGKKITNYQNGKFELTFNNATLLDPNETTDLRIRFKVSIAQEKTNISQKLENEAKIEEIQNKNNIVVIDSDGEWNNKDKDYLNTKIYAVSLEKYVSQINGSALTGINANVRARNGKPEWNTSYSTWKHNNVVTVSNGDYVTYTITVKNDSLDTNVYITEILDTLPTGISSYKLGGYSNNDRDYTQRPSDGKITITRTAVTLLKPRQSTSVYVTVKVSEPNISIDILKNTAEITKMQNKNKVDVEDTTPNNNKDSDYIQMKDITISGTVWNDIAWNKTQGNYNGTYENETGKDKPLPGVTVYLCRNGNSTPIATTKTDSNGKYAFALNYIKGPKASGTNRWAGTYYSYYVVFEYDGVTYTSSTYYDVTSNNENDSNARERLNNSYFNGKVSKTRQAFNNQFSTINNNSGIQYSTKNETDYIPQSNHIAKDANGNLFDKYKMQSSTNLIRLSKTADLEQQLTHVNLGLRGRDVFDLELKTDIYSTRVTVNGKQGTYQYNGNKVTIRKEDIGVVEDAENLARETIESTVVEVGQNIRKTDIDASITGANVTPYDKTKLAIEVTYKITVSNSSQTDGTATKITDYYDSKYNFERAYSSGGNTLTTSSRITGNGYQSITITTPGNNLKQGDTMDIYVVFTLNNATETLQALADGTLTRIPTYNMAEIEEYTTQCASGQTEYTRGLIDKDSAPGSANKEQVRLTSTEGQNTPTIGGNPTTIRYYFGGTADRSILKYEDDTYSTPVLYFTTPDSDSQDPEDPSGGYDRVIKGTVFKDITTIDSETKVKTGNGKLDEGEVGVYGATVTLMELNPNGIEIARYRTTTNEKGEFTISGFLPGDYILKYEYGDTTNTVLLNQAAQDINKDSFNGEDYQSTNNTGSYGVAKLNDTAKFWYVYNEKEGISTATDNVARRNTVSTNVTNFTDEQMTVLNNMRAGKNADDSKVSYQKDGRTETVTVDNIIEQTKMDAGTPSMEFLVEKTELRSNQLEQNTAFGKYVIDHMNFGIAEVPVTEINLQKHVQSFTIVDSTRQNVLASMEKDAEGNWQVKGNVLSETFDVSIEDEKLQGARLEVTYVITSSMRTEKNFDNKAVTVSTITGIVDYIDNNLSYNPDLGDNSKYWELTNYEDTLKEYEKSTYREGTVPKGTVDPEGTIHTTIVKAKTDNPILRTEEGEGTATITLEKVLSATDATLEQIVTSTVDTFAYSNTVEITGLDYKNVTPEGGIPQRDRIRTSDRFIIIPGVQHDSATSEEIVIHPPTGDSSINTMYFVIATISLVILAAGAFGIKKFVLDNKKK